jgi:hypothetical protein
VHVCDQPQALALTDGQVRGQPVHAILLGRPPAAGGPGDIDDDLAALIRLIASG